MKILYVSFSILQIFIFQASYSQDIIFEYDHKNGSLSTNRDFIKSGKSYPLKITQINTANTKAISKQKDFIFVTESPEILKFLGILNTDLKVDQGLSGSSYAQIHVENYYRLLQVVATSIDGLYIKTKNKPNCNLAHSTLQNLLLLFNEPLDSIQLTDFNHLASEVLKYRNYLFQLQRYYQNKSMHPQEEINDNTLENYALTTEITRQVNGMELENKLMYLKESLDGKEYIELKNIKSKKNVVSNSIILIDTYKKDTLAQEEFEFKVYQNWSFRFSTGLFMTSIIESQYYLESRNDQLNNVLEEDIGHVDFSIGALFHYSYYFDRYVHAGLNIGAALSPNDGKLRYLVGGSFIVGHERQVGINFGYTFAFVNQLSDQVRKDDIGYFLEKDKTSVPTAKKFTDGLYLGLTYSLFSKRK